MKFCPCTSPLPQYLVHSEDSIVLWNYFSRLQEIDDFCTTYKNLLTQQLAFCCYHRHEYCFVHVDQGISFFTKALHSFISTGIQRNESFPDSSNFCWCISLFYAWFRFSILSSTSSSKEKVFCWRFYWEDFCRTYRFFKLGYFILISLIKVLKRKMSRVAKFSFLHPRITTNSTPNPCFYNLECFCY